MAPPRTMVTFLALLAFASPGASQQVQRTQQRLTQGSTVPPGEFEAVGSLGNCTATLISQQTVLTAAHCVCPNDQNSANCVKRKSFTMIDVFPAGASAGRRDITIDGNVFVHPEFGKAGWLRKDFALILLDRPVYEVAKVQPMPFATTGEPAAAGQTLTLVGFGPTGSDCTQAKGKQKMALTVTAAGVDGINFQHPGLFVCPGDSGGPAVNQRGAVAGVASWGNGADSSTYRPVYENTEWIESLVDRTGWQKFSAPVSDFLIAYDPVESIHSAYAVDRSTGDVLRKMNPAAPWIRIGGPGKVFVLARGYSLFALSPDGASVQQYQGAPGRWIPVGGPSTALYGLQTGLYSIDPNNGDILRYRGTPYSWERVGGPGKHFASDRQSLYGLSPDGNAVFRYDGSPGNWTRIGGAAGSLYAGIGGLFATDPQNGDLIRYKGQPNQWERAGGPGRTFAVGNSVFGLSPDGAGVYRYSGAAAAWSRVGDAAERIFAGGNLVCATNPATFEVFCLDPLRVRWP